MLHMEHICYQHLFNKNNFATSVALTEVCALLSVILVKLLKCCFCVH